MDKREFMGVVGNVTDFRTLCENSDFPHRKVILDALASNRFSLTVTDGPGVPSVSMLDIYRRRLRIGEERYLKTSHAQNILSDVRFYVSGLERIEDDFIRIWHLAFDEISHFSVFEAEGSGKIVGCVHGIDRRKVTPREWEWLWREE